jgi:large subunit ribosomal protein L22
MEAKAIARYVRISPHKAREVADLIRGQEAEQALAILRYTPKKASRIIAKVLRSAIANADMAGALVEELTITKIYVDEGPRLKRWRPRAFGRATRILKPTSHITVVVDDGEEPL